jgi:hypothetical protein
MDDFTTRQLAQMRFGIADFRERKIELNTFLARLEGAARAISQEFWGETVFDLALELEQFNADVIEEQRSLTSEESSQVEALLTRLEGRLDQVQ